MRPPFSLGTVTYDFSHLASFTVTVPCSQAGFIPAKIVVTFSHHVFTEAWDDTVHTIQLAVTENGEKRAFCLERYNWSLELAEIVRYHVAGRAFWGRDRNGMWNNFFYEQRNGRLIPYAVYFRVGKSTNLTGIDGILHVISGYENSKLPRARSFTAVKFGTIVSKEIGFKKEPEKE